MKMSINIRSTPDDHKQLLRLLLLVERTVSGIGHLLRTNVKHCWKFKNEHKWILLNCLLLIETVGVD